MTGGPGDHGDLPNSAASERQVTAEQPWPGLLSFTEGDSAFFFGRDAESEELVDLVVNHRFTTLYGLSGLGKTSLLSAGLSPRLRQRGFLPVRLRLDLEPGAPSASSQILTALVEELRRTRSDGPAPTSDDTIWEYLHRLDVTLWSSRHRPLTPVLILDQFEEIFSRTGRDAAGHERRAPIVDAIGDLAEGRVPMSVKSALEKDPALAGRFQLTDHRYRVLVALREDYLADFDDLAADIPSLHRSRMRLGPMRGSTAVQAVRAAADASGILTPEVAFGIVRFVGESAISARRGVSLPHLPIEPALLSVVCRELNEERLRAGRPQITLEQLDTSEAILRRFYEGGIEGSPDTLRRFLEDRLVTSDGMREMVAYQTLAAVPGVSDTDIQRLIDRRILRTEYRDGRRLLELTHDRLAPVLVESRAARQRGRSGEPRVTIGAGGFASVLAGLRYLAKPRAVDDALANLLDTAIAAVRADRGLVMLGASWGVLVPRYIRDRAGWAPTRPSVGIGREILAETLALGQLKVFSNTNTADHFRDLVCVPLLTPAADETHRPTDSPSALGVLCLYSEGRLDLVEDGVAQVRSIALEMAAVLESGRLYRAVAEHERLDRELQMAAEIQQRLLPKGALRGTFYDAAALVVPTRNVAGDFFDYKRLPDGSLWFAVCDVAGKGPTAAMLASTIQGMLAVQEEDVASTAKVLQRLNKALTARAVEARWATLFCGVLTGGGKLSFSNAGHTAPLRVGSQGVQRLEIGGVPLAILEHAPYEEETIALEPGDLLIVYSDGVTEALDANGEEFGEARLGEYALQLRAKSAADALAAIVERIREFTAGAPSDDDMTAMVIRYLG